MQSTEMSPLQRIYVFVSHPSVSGAIFVLMALATLGLWQYSTSQSARNSRDLFLSRVEKQQAVLVNHMRQYEQALRGGVGLFAAADSVSRAQWRSYVEALEPDKHLPGIGGIGFSLMLPLSEREALEARMRAEGFPDYSILPAGDRDPLTSIIYLEPFTGRNMRAFGYDMYSEPVRREAMQRAWNSGQPALSGKVKLVQETEHDIQAGFLVYLPVYRNGMPLGNVNERRAALHGFVYAPFRATDLMDEVFSKPANEIELELFDGAPAPGNLLFTSETAPRTARHTLARQITIAGHLWTARFHSSREFETLTAGSQPRLILIGGLALSLLVFVMLYMTARHHRHLYQVTARLEESRSEFRKLVGNSPGSVFRCEANAPWRLQYISQAIEALTGMAPQRFLSGETSLRQLVHPDDMDGLVATIARATETRQPYNIDYRLNDINRQLHWVNERAEVQFDENGQALWLDGLLLDVTAQKTAEQKLQAASRYARSLLEASVDPLVTISADGKIMDANKATEAITGVAREALIGSDFCDYFTEPEQARSGYEKVFSQGFVTDYPLVIRHASGQVTDVLYNASVYRDETGKVAGIFAAARDVSTLKRSQQELADTNREILILGQMTNLLQSCQSAAEAHPIILATLARLFPDSSGACFMINESGNLLEQVSSWGRETLPDTVIPPDDCWALRQGHLHAVGFGQDINPHCKHFRAGEAPYLCAPLLAQGKALGIIHLAISQAAENEAQLQRRRQLAETATDSISLALANLKLRESLHILSFHDPLTGLFNRRFMEETLARELIRTARVKKSLAIAMMDVDKFKHFNDTYGHEAGDLVLKEVARLMLGFRIGSDVACRFGGEEFILVLPEMTLELARTRLEQFRIGIEQLKLNFNGQPLPSVTISIGIAIFPDHGTTPAALIRSADMALYRAKKNGRNRIEIAESGSVASSE